MADDNGAGKGLLFGLIAGGAIGAVLGMLYAPKSGRELRDELRSKSDEYLDDADRYLAEAKDRAKELINEGKKRSDKLISDAKVKSDELLKDAEKVLNDAKGKAGKIVDQGKASFENEATKLKSAVKAGVDAYKETKKS
ncbi:MAG TPA: YtxH domain-containing protein [Ignavibacteriaceae bacterium]|nr:YtxH domain-containing protein [Ignavibacteriaceae bacterium]